LPSAKGTVVAGQAIGGDGQSSGDDGNRQSRDFSCDGKAIIEARFNPERAEPQKISPIGLPATKCVISRMGWGDPARRVVEIRSKERELDK
jgi:hypothetical protein